MFKEKSCSKLAVFIAALCVFMFVPPAHAASLFDWQQEWGRIDFTSPNDPKIPSSQLQPKADIERVVSNCGTNFTDLSDIKTYSIPDVDGDGRSDIMMEPKRYFTKYLRAGARPDYCNVCASGQGCFIVLYRRGPTSQMSFTPDSEECPEDGDKDCKQSCPAEAALNVDCKPGCPSLQSRCPANFDYKMHATFDARVFAWTFWSANDFRIRTSGKPYVLRHAGPVLRLEMGEDKCFLAELELNGNRCVKYMQYSGGLGYFVDLYTPNVVQEDVVYDPPGDALFTAPPYSVPNAIQQRGHVMGDGEGHKIDPGERIDIEFDSFTRVKTDGTKTDQFEAWKITNNASDSYFIPAKTDEEFNSFLNSASRLNVTVEDADRRFNEWTPWSGCPSLGSTRVGMTEVRTRTCQRSTSSYAPCSECVSRKVADDFALGCIQSQRCPLPPPAQSNNSDCFAGEALVLMADKSERRIDQVKADDEVMGFETIGGKLIPMKVKGVVITKDQGTTRINNTLSVTSDHRTLTIGGIWKWVRDLALGDALQGVDASKEPVVVKSLAFQTGQQNVYGLEIDGVGIVVNGLRVSARSPAVKDSEKE